MPIERRTAAGSRRCDATGASVDLERPQLFLVLLEIHVAEVSECPRIAAHARNQHVVVRAGRIVVAARPLLTRDGCGEVVEGGRVRVGSIELQFVVRPIGADLAPAQFERRDALPRAGRRLARVDSPRRTGRLRPRLPDKPGTKAPRASRLPLPRTRAQAGTPAVSSPRNGVATGRVNQIVVPRPSALSIPTAPPCASTKCFTMASPSPVPPRARERAGSIL